MKLREGLRTHLVVAVAVLVWAAAVYVCARGPDGPSQEGLVMPSRSPARPVSAVGGFAAVQSSGFVGDDTCTACHESEGKGLRTTLHGKAQNSRTPAARPNQACETCHGPGREHAESGDKTKIKVFTAMAPKDVSETCLTCHSRGAHGQWNGGMHDARNLSCASCHSVHSPKSEVA